PSAERSLPTTTDPSVSSIRSAAKERPTSEINAPKNNGRIARVSNVLFFMLAKGERPRQLNVRNSNRLIEFNPSSGKSHVFLIARESQNNLDQRHVDTCMVPYFNLS